MNSLIAFDAAGTLFETAEPVEDVYADCFSTLGFGIPEATWKKAFSRAFSITPDPIYPESGSGHEVEKEWWRDLVRRAAQATGIRPDPETMSMAFDELFDFYSTGYAWKLFPETESVLTSLKKEGHVLAVTSNFDSRIHQVLQDLGIDGHFDHILTSADVKARKPSPRILEKLLAETSTAPSDCCLVGDSLTADKGAADAAGITFYHVNRPEKSLHDFAEWHTKR